MLCYLLINKLNTVVILQCNSEYVEIWYAVKHDDNETQGTCNLTQL